MSFSSSFKDVVKEIVSPKVLVGLAVLGAVVWAGSHAYHLRQDQIQKQKPSPPKSEISGVRAASQAFDKFVL